MSSPQNSNNKIKVVDGATLYKEIGSITGFSIQESLLNDDEIFVYAKDVGNGPTLYFTDPSGNEFEFQHNESFNPYNLITGDTTLTSDQKFINASGNITLTLPNASGTTGDLMVIKNNGDNQMTITGATGETIEKENSFTLYGAESINIYSDGLSNWIIT